MELTSDGSHAYLGARNFSYSGVGVLEGHQTTSEQGRGRLEGIIKEESNKEELLNRPDSPILPQESEFFYSMMGLRERHKQKRQSHLMHITAASGKKPYVPFYEKLAINLDLAMKP